MAPRPFRIGVVAPSRRLDPALAERAIEFVRAWGSDVELVVHPQCFLAHGHFAGSDAERAAAVIEVAESPSIDAVWFARGGYGAARIAEAAAAGLSRAALAKPYLGYSDAGALLAALFNRGAPHLAHGPMIGDLAKPDGERALARGLDWLTTRSPETLEPSLKPGQAAAAFNLTVLASLVGTPLEPDLTGRVLLVEDVDEPHYRLDRALQQVLSSRAIGRLAGLRLGRCSAIPANDVDFGRDEAEIAEDRCAAAGVAYLGRADIGHDVDNKIAPFGAPDAFV